MRQDCVRSGTRKRTKWRELGFLFIVALDSHRFWVFPFGVLDKFTVKIYDNSARYREYENTWELLEKLNQSGLFLVHLFGNALKSLKNVAVGEGFEPPVRTIVS